MHRLNTITSSHVRYQRLEDRSADEQPGPNNKNPRAIGACVKAVTVSCRIAGPDLGRHVQQVARDIRTPIEQAEQQKIAAVLFKEAHRL